MFTAKSYRKVPQRSLSPPCPFSSWTTTSTSTQTTRRQSSAGISPLPKEGTWSEAEERIMAAFAIPSVQIQVGYDSSWLLPMMMTMALQTQHLHPTRRPQPRSLHHLCCLLTAPTPPWSPPMAPPKDHTSLTCHLHLPQQEVSPCSCPP